MNYCELFNVSKLWINNKKLPESLKIENNVKII